GLYNATDFKPACIQIYVLPTPFDLGQEDCLYLNVFTPIGSDTTLADLKKVFVFFHGGANIQGFPSGYLPGTLVTEQDIIVVTVAYRLGYLGVLSTMTPSCQGNLNLKDQLMSLAWVKKHIQDFGGDPAAVTIGGQSAGGFDSSFLALLPQSRDLFTRVYCASGATGSKNTLLITNPRPDAIKISRKLGCLRVEQPDPVADSEFEKLVDCLKKVPAENFAINETTDIPTLQSTLSNDLFPKKMEELLSDENYLKSVNFFDRDYLVSVTDNEGYVYNLLYNYILSVLPAEMARLLTPQVILFQTIQSFIVPAFGPVSQQVIQKVAEYYGNNFHMDPLADFVSDAMFNIQSLQFVTAVAGGRSSQDSRVHFFQFAYSPEYVLDPSNGFPHAFDLVYLFDLDMEFVIKLVPAKVDGSKWNKNDDLLRQKFIKLVADFIKTGNPAKSLTSELPSGWPGFDQKQQQYLEFGLNLTVKQYLIKERVQLWSEQIPKWIQEFPVNPRVQLASSISSTTTLSITNTTTSSTTSTTTSSSSIRNNCYLKLTVAVSLGVQIMIVLNRFSE
ncbi:unnamed protein product, partial [Candidula unifasciata]